MPEKLFLILRPVVTFLIAVGTPVLFFFKIILWAVYWLGRQVLGLFDFVVYLFVQIFLTFRWLGNNVYKSLRFYLLSTYKVQNTIFKFIANLRIKLRRELKSRKKKVNKSLSQVAKTYHPQIKVNVSWKWTLVIFFVIILAVVGGAIFITLRELPNPHSLSHLNSPVTTKIYDRNGTLLYEIYAKENRSIISLADIPPDLINATVAYEDKNFYNHHGVDIRGIVRAAVANLDGKPTQGGSTLTQQLIKSTLLTPERTVERKIKEVILSVWAEQIYSKQDILQMYFNQIPYGGEAYGIEAAAETYFGKPAKDLTLAESALLAGLPSSPSTYSPFGTHPEKAKAQQLQVLKAMQEQGYISKFQMVSAENEPLNFKNPSTEIKAPHFVMYVKDYLVSKYGIRMVEQGGLEVRTSLDYPTYQMVLDKLRVGVDKQKYLNVGNGAALVLNPQTGEILAMVGSTDYFDQDHDGNVNVAIADRSPGSSIKALTYALALEKKLITPATVIDDAPVTFPDPSGPPYSPQNYDNRFHGRVTVRTALAASLNIPAVKILSKLGVSSLIDKGREVGIDSWQDKSRYGLSLTLGGGENTMVELARLYGALANGGKKINPKPVVKVIDYQGNVLENNTDTKPTEQVFSKETTFLVSDILADNGARSLAFGPASALVIPGKTVSVKTGTTQEKRDNWTIGYTPEILTAVWVGNNDNTPMNPYLESGNTGAAAIWNPIMTELLKDKPNQPLVRPDGVATSTICMVNGLLTCDNCPGTKTEYFIQGTQPSTACTFSKEDLDRINKEREERAKNSH